MSGLILGAMLWVFNLNLLWYIITSSQLDLYAKSNVFIGSLEAVYTNFDSGSAASLLFVCVILGMNFSALLYILGNSKQAAARDGAATGLSALAVAIGSGCAACGASILTPLLTATGATATIGTSRQLGVMANIIGFGLALWSMYGLGKRAATIQAAEKLSG